MRKLNSYSDHRVHLLRRRQMLKIQRFRPSRRKMERKLLPLRSLRANVRFWFKRKLSFKINWNGRYKMLKIRLQSKMGNLPWTHVWLSLQTSTLITRWRSESLKIRLRQWKHSVLICRPSSRRNKLPVKKIQRSFNLNSLSCRPNWIRFAQKSASTNRLRSRVWSKRSANLTRRSARWQKPVRSWNNSST